MNPSPEKLTNLQLVGTFQLNANLLEIQGEVIYKILAHLKGAEIMGNRTQPECNMAKQLPVQIG